VLGDGIFNVDGPRWYEQRKTSSHLFKHANFKAGMLDSVNRVADEACRLVGAAAKEGATMDMSRLFWRCTLDTIGEIAFGRDLGSLR
jgi:cytochrome P450